MTSSCPADDRLLAAAAGESDAAEILRHAEACPVCRRILERLRAELAALRSFSGEFDRSRSPTLAAAGTSKPTAVAVRARPASIGRYVVLDELGSGGQARVYRVVDPELGRPLVLKLSRQAGGEGEVRRDAVLAEGRLLAELDHPGLVRVFDAGVHDGHAYLVLEQVPGRNLEQHFAHQLPPAREAARLVAGLARVLAYAHRRGVVHGDVKPQNILIDGESKPRLIDFGLARLDDAWAGDAASQGGTPEFLPPELAPSAGGRRRAGPAGDVFGLGATLYWLLTGQAPFAAGTLMAVLDRAARCDIDRGPLHQSSIPRRLAAVCLQALAADPAARPAADGWAGQLERAAGPWRGSRRAAAAIVGALALVFLVAAVGRWRRPTVVQSAPHVHVLRGNQSLNLSNVLPLRTGDQITFSCDVSAGEQVTVLWFDAAGKLHEFQPAREVSDRLDKIIYPPGDSWHTLPLPEGTDMIFFCRGGKPTLDERDSCFPLGQRIPELPPQIYLELRRGWIEANGPHQPGSPDAERIARTNEMLAQIDRLLRRHYAGVTAVAFPHRRPLGAKDDED